MIAPITDSTYGFRALVYLRAIVKRWIAIIGVFYCILQCTSFRRAIEFNRGHGFNWRSGRAGLNRTTCPHRACSDWSRFSDSLCLMLDFLRLFSG